MVVQATVADSVFLVFVEISRTRTDGERFVILAVGTSSEGSFVPVACGVGSGVAFSDGSGLEDIGKYNCSISIRSDCLKN